jgi:putative thioredoxin
MTDHIVDIDINNAQAMLIEESLKRLVVVDFWADWCEPCKNLMPVLEKLANEYDGQFLLAKVNADTENMIASQFGVRSLPTVMLIKDGQPIDGFTGAQPESAVREILDKHLPKPWDLQLQEALSMIESEQYAAAVTVLADAYQSSGQRADIAFCYARALIECRRLEEAQSVVDSVKLADQDNDYKQVLAQLELAQQAGKAPEIEALETQLASKPGDLNLALQLASQYATHDYYKEALELLFPLVASDLNALDGELKRAFMDVLAQLEKGDPLGALYQRKLYTLLY